jgi:membrane protein implicated in regulation of membrane protease activity
MHSLDSPYADIYPSTTTTAEPSTVAAILLAAGVVLFIGTVSALSSAIRSHVVALTALLRTAAWLFVVAVVALALIFAALLSGNANRPPDQNGPGPIQQDRPPHAPG